MKCSYLECIIRKNLCNDKKNSGSNQQILAERYLRGAVWMLWIYLDGCPQWRFASVIVEKPSIASLIKSIDDFDVLFKSDTNPFRQQLLLITNTVRLANISRESAGKCDTSQTLVHPVSQMSRSWELSHMSMLIQMFSLSDRSRSNNLCSKSSLHDGKVIPWPFDKRFHFLHCTARRTSPIRYSTECIIDGFI
jgi:hypothetical protein